MVICTTFFKLYFINELVKLFVYIDDIGQISDKLWSIRFVDGVVYIHAIVFTNEWIYSVQKNPRFPTKYE